MNKPRNILFVVMLGIISISAAMVYTRIQDKKAGSLNNITLRVDGMTCQGCVSKITNALQKVKGVKEVTVSLEAKNAMITYDVDKTNPNQLAELINSEGFTVIKTDSSIDR